MKQLTYADAEAIRRGVLFYLRIKYGHGLLTWHPLYTATRELYVYLIDKLDAGARE